MTQKEITARTKHYWATLHSLGEHGNAIYWSQHLSSCFAGDHGPHVSQKAWDIFNAFDQGEENNA